MDPGMPQKLHGCIVSLLVLLLFAVQSLIWCRQTNSRQASHTQLSWILAEPRVIKSQRGDNLLASMKEQTREGLTSPLHLHREL